MTPRAIHIYIPNPCFPLLPELYSAHLQMCLGQGQEAADNNKKACLLSIYSVPGHASDGFTLEYKLHEGKDFFFCVGLCCLLKQGLAHIQCCYVCCVNEENET